MAKQQLIKQDGVITEALSNAMFKVKLENGHEILATISGKMRMNFILNHNYQGVISRCAVSLE